MVFSQSVVINQPRQVVWDYITTPENWKKWYGHGGLISVEPGWQKGAELELGAPGLKQTISECVPPELLCYGKQETTLRLSDVGDSATEFEYSMEHTDPDWDFDPGLLRCFREAFSERTEKTLEKLKSLLEGEDD